MMYGQENIKLNIDVFMCLYCYI